MQTSKRDKWEKTENVTSKQSTPRHDFVEKKRERVRFSKGGLFFTPRYKNMMLNEFLIYN